jgi:Zn-dependent M28 family amino/carboxypeptidase
VGLTVSDDLWPQESFFTRSDHYNFARRGVPALFFFNGTHEDYHRPGDSPEKIDAEKAARVVQLVYHTAVAVANAPRRPEWDAESRRKIVERP